MYAREREHYDGSGMVNLCRSEIMLKQLERRITDRQCWLFLAACKRHIFPVLQRGIGDEEQVAFTAT